MKWVRSRQGDTVTSARLARVKIDIGVFEQRLRRNQISIMEFLHSADSDADGDVNITCRSLNGGICNRLTQFLRTAAGFRKSRTVEHKGKLFTANARAPIRLAPQALSYFHGQLL